ncbi:hypothetical protein [Furfurilactobacillus cerevisiae]|uniref:hypothetical protein n=1 Tax=Furfurilactobacillus rossiae TaxID=231049 RepID=UPI003B980A35
MSKFILNVEFSADFNANSKAKMDVTHFLNQESYTTISVPYLQGKDKLKIRQTISAITKKLVPGDILFIQYPTYLGFVINELLLSWCQRHGVKTIGLMHDLEAVRLHFPAYKFWKSLKAEVHRLNKFNYVIPSNDDMGNFLEENGMKTPWSGLGIFDYYHEEQLPNNDPQLRNVVNFAGNLKKSKFISPLTHTNFKTGFRFFGVKNDDLNFPKNMKYAGIFPPEKLIDELKNGYGLVWDGSSIETCDGLLGNYLKFNNPHKTSLYLSAGMPVVIWKEAALGKFVEENKVGVLVSSLTELDAKLSEISEKQYIEMQMNAQNLSKKLTSGFYVKSAARKALNFLEKEVD